MILTIIHWWSINKSISVSPALFTGSSLQLVYLFCTFASVSCNRKSIAPIRSAFIDMSGPNLPIFAMSECISKSKQTFCRKVFNILDFQLMVFYFNLHIQVVWMFILDLNADFLKGMDVFPDVIEVLSLQIIDGRLQGTSL